MHGLLRASIYLGMSNMRTSLLVLSVAAAACIATTDTAIITNTVSATSRRCIVATAWCSGGVTAAWGARWSDQSDRLLLALVPKRLPEGRCGSRTGMGA